MGRFLKIILTIFTVVILLIITAVVILPLVIDPNDFKPEIQQAVKKNTGRDLNIEGDLELSVFPWIGISTGKLTLSNAAGFSDKYFAEIIESNIKVKLLPLLSKNVEVSRVVLKGLVLNLAKNKKGVSNWSDLTQTEETEALSDSTDAAEKDSVSPLAALAIGGISIEQAKIVWDDQQQGTYTEINDFNFKTDKLVFDQPIAIALSLNVLNKEPELTESIKITTDLIINKQLNKFDLKQLVIDSTTSGKELPGGKLSATAKTDIALDLVQQTLNIPELRINTGDLTLIADITGTQIKDRPAFKGSVRVREFNLAQLLNKMSIALPDMQGPNALNKLSIAFDLQATADSADIHNLVVNLDDTNINGSSSINHFAKPEIVFDINIDTINVDRYLAPVNESGSSSKPAVTPATAAVAGAALFPVETLRELNAKGLIKIDKLKINHLNMQGLSLQLDAKNGVIKTQQDIKQFYKGAYSGNSAINVQQQQPRLSLNEKLTNVHIEPLLIDFKDEARITGVVNATASVKGRGNTAAAIKSSLNGNVAFNFKDGVVRGVNLQKMIDNGKALLKGTPLPKENKNDQTVFSVLSGTANITNGLVTNNDLYVESSKLRVNGKGTVHLASEKIDYKVNTKLLKVVATATEPEKIKGIPLFINIGGTINKPVYTLDLAAMFMNTDNIKLNKKKDKLLKKLDKALGPEVGDLIKGLF